MGIFQNDYDRIRFQLHHKFIMSAKIQGLTQKQIAELCNTSQPAISRALKGNQKLKIGTLIRYLASLGVKVKFTVAPNHHLLNNTQ